MGMLQASEVIRLESSEEAAAHPWWMLPASESPELWRALGLARSIRCLSPQQYFGILIDSQRLSY